MRAVGEHDLVFRDTALSDLSGATRCHASALCCDVTVTCLSPHGVLLCRSGGVVHELTVTTGVDRVTVHELLLARRQQVVGGEEPCTTAHNGDA